MGSICTWNPFSFIKADAESNWLQLGAWQYGWDSLPVSLQLVSCLQFLHILKIPTLSNYNCQNWWVANAMKTMWRYWSFWVSNNHCNYLLSNCCAVDLESNSKRKKIVKEGWYLRRSVNHINTTCHSTGKDWETQKVLILFQLQILHWFLHKMWANSTNQITLLRGS